MSIGRLTADLGESYTQSEDHGGTSLARTIEELDVEVNTLRADVDRLKQQAESWPAVVRQWAGRFTDDAEWAAIHEKIEQERRQPDPELTEP
jgi:hypothetical protein